MCPPDPGLALRVRCPHCRAIDWRTPVQLAGARPFTCYICLGGSDRPLPVRSHPVGCAARLRTLRGALRRLFGGNPPAAPG